jgi:hypothetical protein
MKVKTTYRQMFAPPASRPNAPGRRLAVIHALKPTVAFFRFLYDAVGRD